MSQVGENTSESVSQLNVSDLRVSIREQICCPLSFESLPTLDALSYVGNTGENSKAISFVTNDSSGYSVNLREQVVDRLNDDLSGRSTAENEDENEDENDYSPFEFSEVFVTPELARSSEFRGCDMNTLSSIEAYINDPANTRFKRILDAAITSLLTRAPSDPLYFMVHEMVRLNAQPEVCAQRRYEKCPAYPSKAPAIRTSQMERDVGLWLDAALEKFQLHEDIESSDEDLERWLLEGWRRQFPEDVQPFGVTEEELRGMVLDAIKNIFKPKESAPDDIPKSLALCKFWNKEREDTTEGLKGDVSKWLIEAIKEFLPEDNNC